MGYIKQFIMDNQGAGWKPFEELTESELLEIEIALATEKPQMACIVCFSIIPSGNTCDTHKGQKPNW